MFEPYTVEGKNRSNIREVNSQMTEKYPKTEKTEEYKDFDSNSKGYGTTFQSENGTIVKN